MKASLLHRRGRGRIRLRSFVRPCVRHRSQEAAIVESATNVLTEFMSMPNEGIPRRSMLQAQGLVIVPGMVKVGLVAAYGTARVSP